MSYPSRPLVSEPFVGQIETIDKTWIEVQNQPSTYFPRRNNRALNGNGNMNAHQSPTLAPSSNYNKYYYSGQQEYYGNYRPNTNTNASVNAASNTINGMANMGNMGGISGMPGMGVNPGSGLSVGGAANGMNSMGGSNGGVSPNGLGAKALNKPPSLMSDRLGSGNSMSPVSNVAQIPEVFGKMSSSPETFSTFDPFNDTSGTLFQLPLFNSSSNILSSNFTSTSSNIWGNSNKGISDAAVWG